MAFTAACTVRADSTVAVLRVVHAAVDVVTADSLVRHIALAA